MAFRYHESSQMSSLVETFVSKASALQRQGRAGRVRNGFCFRLYPKYRYGRHGLMGIQDVLIKESKRPGHSVPVNLLCFIGNPFDFRFDAFMEYSIPEILRVPLEELCLHIMVYKPHTSIKHQTRPKTCTTCGKMIKVSAEGVFSPPPLPPLPSGRNVSMVPRRTFWAEPWILLSPSLSVTPSTCWGRLVRVTPTTISSPLWGTTWLAFPSTWRLARCSSTERSSAAWSPSCVCHHSQVRIITVICPFGSWNVNKRFFFRPPSLQPSQRNLPSPHRWTERRKLTWPKPPWHWPTLITWLYTTHIWGMKLSGVWSMCDADLDPGFISLTLYYVRWKKSQTEGQRADMSYCRKHFLNRTALVTIEVRHTFYSENLILGVISLLHLLSKFTHSHPGC